MDRMSAGTAWMERHQVALFFGALGLGAAMGVGLPNVAGAAGAAVNPVLGLLLYATFLGVPFSRLRSSLRDGRFLLTLAVLNFAVVPAVAWAVTRLISGERALLVGALFVLLAPCIDYVIVFAGLAGGSARRLLAASPLLMLAQMVMLPLYLRLFVGSEVAAAVDPRPFAQALVLLILLPMAAAALTQFAASRTRWGSGVHRTVTGAMVPLMMLTLGCVTASQIAGVGAHLESLLRLVPTYVLFVVVMIPLGAIAGRAARLDPAARRAVIFSGTTRNGLVVLPLVLALPAEFSLAPLAVIVQTLVELIAMVAMVRLVPRLVPRSRPTLN